jgi:hypothetical protein
MKTLTQLAELYGTDKCYSRHNYMLMYEFWLGKLNINSLLEIGLGKGASARMWIDYFPDAEVYMMENYSKEYNEEWGNPDLNDLNCTIIKGDSTDPVTWNNVPDNLSFIIDDGDHLPESQIATFMNGFPKLRSNGLYFIEDTHCGFEKKYGGDNRLYIWASRLYMQQQLAELNTEGDFYKFRYMMPDIIKDIYSYHFYKSVILFQKA